jgi:hypothetical protein
VESIRIADPWWRVVEEIARMFEPDGFKQSELADNQVKENLLAAGHDETAVNVAINCVEKAFLSGNVYDCLTMTHKYGSEYRVLHPAERAFIPTKIWQGLLACQKRGVITSDVFERLVESIRLFDFRGLTDAEISDVFYDMLSSNLPQHILDTVFAIVEGRTAQTCH